MKDLKYQYEKLTEYVQYCINENQERKRNKANMIKEKKNYLEKQYNGKKVTIFAIIAIIISLIAVSIIPTNIGIIIISVLIVLFIIFWLLYSSLQTKTFQSEDLLEQTYENVNAPFKRLLEKLLLQKILTTESEEKGINQIVNLIQWGYNAANILYNLKLLVEIHNKKLLGDSRKGDIEGIFSIQKEDTSIAKNFSNLRKDLIHPTVLRDFIKILLDNTIFFNINDFNQSVPKPSFSLCLKPSEFVNLRYGNYFNFMKTAGYFKANEFSNKMLRKKICIDRNYQIVSVV